jgi:hypothetical protein
MKKKTEIQLNFFPKHNKKINFFHIYMTKLSVFSGEDRIMFSVLFVVRTVMKKKIELKKDF